jgi:hypothetical protein
MSKLTDYYMTLGICNACGFAGTGNVFIDYYPYDDLSNSGREYVVCRPGFQTNPNDKRWFNYGNKVFPLSSYAGSVAERRRLALRDAQEWASKEFGVAKWKRTPFGSWMEEEFVNRRMRQLAKK